MPAVVRGGRRQSAKPAPRKTGKAPPPRRTGPRGQPLPAGKLSALSGLNLSPRATGVAVFGFLIFCGAVTLATGGRAQALSEAAAGTIDAGMGAIGFKLERVHVEGASAAALPAIKAAMQLHRGDPIARMDLDAIKTRLETVGWVKDVKVLRLLPDTLVVSVVERERMAVWQHQGQAVVIDELGKPIKGAYPAQFSALPLVVGDGANDTAGQILPLVRQRPRLMGKLEALVRVDGRRWDLRLKDGSLIQLPALKEESALIQLDQLDQKQRLLELGFARIDLRDPDMIAVRPAGAKAPTPAPAVAG